MIENSPIKAVWDDAYLSESITLLRGAHDYIHAKIRPHDQVQKFNCCLTNYYIPTRLLSQTNPKHFESAGWAQTIAQFDSISDACIILQNLPTFPIRVTFGTHHKSRIRLRITDKK